MNGFTGKKLDLVFSTHIASCTEDEFIVEFYPYTPDLNCSGNPVKVTKNFDELIGFFEEMEELEQ